MRQRDAALSSARELQPRSIWRALTRTGGGGVVQAGAGVGAGQTEGGPHGDGGGRGCRGGGRTGASLRGHPR
eukprot:2142564-Rhodomonas_salina.1